MSYLTKFHRIFGLPRLETLQDVRILSNIIPSRKCSGTPTTRDKETVFFDPDVQSLLRKLTGLNYEKIFRIKKLGRELEKPVYQFLTNEELEEAREEMRKKALEKLQMPPVMEERNLLGQVLERDPQLTGFDTCKYVFTDITFGVPDRSRLITVRDPDGTLRMANRDEQDRLNESYFPRKLRKHYVPQMFEPENLEKLLGPEKYEYILDRNCLQFEPDNAIYIKVAETVYQHVNQTKNFDSLHSTRHFGPLMFYLTWTKQLDESIVHFIRKDSVEDAAAAITLHTKIHPESRLNSMPEAKSCGAEDLVRLFAKYDSVKSSKISMALDKLIEVKEMNKRTKSDILESHGAT